MSVPPPINVVAQDPEERSLAALAHGSIILNFFVPGLGIIAALAVWLTQRDRSAYAAKQALQAGIYQIVWTVVPVFMIIMGVVGLILGGAFVAMSDVRIGAGLLIAFLLGALALAAFVIIGLLYALVAAYEAYQGRAFRYWLIGRLIH
jgi:uncharacterized Tic20 family protein